jgi:hypothetical protein
VQGEIVSRSPSVAQWAPPRWNLRMSLASCIATTGDSGIVPSVQRNRVALRLARRSECPQSAAVGRDHEYHTKVVPLEM